MYSQRYVCLTGIKDPNKKQLYKQYLLKLNYTLTDTLQHQTKLLIVQSILTQKYKIYQLFFNHIPCVTSSWLIQSINTGIQQSFSLYFIPSLFSTTNIAIYGFDQDIIHKLTFVIQSKGGNVLLIKNITIYGDIRVIEQHSNIEVLIIPKKIANRIGIMDGGQLKPPKFPCVGIQWLQACLQTGNCRYPVDYAYNYLYIKPRRRQKQIMKLLIYKQKLINQLLINQNISYPQKQIQLPQQTKTITQTNPNSQTPQPIPKSPQNPQNPPSSLFQNYYFYFYSQIQNSQLLILQLLKPIISMKSGLYLDNFLPIITHIIVDQIYQFEFLQLMKFGNHIPILRIQWLIDTILYCHQPHHTIYQHDYQVRSFKDMQHLDKITSLQPLLQSNNQLNSPIFHHNYQIKQPKHLTLNNESRSTNINQLSNTHKQQQKQYQNPSISKPSIKQIPIIKKKMNYKSNIFKNIIFYIPNKYRKQKQFKNIVTSIRENGGVAYDKPKNNKIMYCILLDGPQIQTIYQQLSKGYEQNLRPVSFRWIRYCVKKQQYIQYNQLNYFIFKPFKFQIPIFSFFVCKFEIIGVNDIFKMRIRQLLDELGSKKIKPTISQITHCLCCIDINQIKLIDKLQKITYNQQFKQNQSQIYQKIQQITKSNQKVKFIKLQWIFDCLNTGQILPLQQYKITYFITNTSS